MQCRKERKATKLIKKKAPQQQSFWKMGHHHHRRYHLLDQKAFVNIMIAASNTSTSIIQLCPNSSS